jgi:hypothetical protein
VQEADWLRIIMGISKQTILYGLDLRDFIWKYIKMYDFVRPEINVVIWNTRQRKAVKNCPWQKLALSNKLNRVGFMLLPVCRIGELCKRCIYLNIKGKMTENSY